jgi:hypothetical protein
VLSPPAPARNAVASAEYGEVISEGVVVPNAVVAGAADGVVIKEASVVVTLLYYRENYTALSNLAHSPQMVHRDASTERRYALLPGPPGTLIKKNSDKHKVSML